MKYRLLALDIDGTLENEKFPLDPQIKSIIESFEKKGGITTLISGRLPGGMVEIGQKLKLPPGRLISGADGAVVSELSEKMSYKVVTCLEIEFTKIIDFIGPFPGLLLTPHKIVEVGPVNDIMHHLAKITGPDIFSCKSWENAKKLVGKEPIIGLRFLIERQSAKQLILLLKKSNSNRFEVFDNREFSDGYIGISVRPLHGDKGSVLSTIASHYNIPMETTIALGDWVTDIPMLLKARFSSAPSDSLDQVKESANHVSSWNMKDSWAKRELEILIGS